MLSPNRVFLPIGKTFLPGVKKPSHKKYSPALNPGQPGDSGLPGALPSARGRFQTTGPCPAGPSCADRPRSCGRRLRQAEAHKKSREGPTSLPAVNHHPVWLEQLDDAVLTGLFVHGAFLLVHVEVRVAQGQQNG